MKKGFTLIEVIVALTIGTIVVGSMLALLAPVYKIYSRREAITHAQMISGNLLDEMRTLVSKASSANAKTDPSGASFLQIGSNVIAVSKSGYLTLDGTLLFSEDYYEGNKVLMHCTQAGIDKVTVELTLKNGESVDLKETATMATMRSLLSIPDKYTPEGMLRITQGVIAEVTGPKPWEYNDIVFDTVYNEYYGKSFPRYSVYNVIPKAKLQELAKKAIETNPSGKEAAYWKNLLKDDGLSTTMAVFISKTSLVPIVYLTTYAPGLANRHSSVAMLYYEGAWYYSADFSMGYILPELNNKTAQQISERVADRAYWIPVSWL